MVEQGARPYLIAVGLDGSQRSWKAFEEAVQLSKLRPTTLHVVSIQESIEASYSATDVLAAEKTGREKLEKVQVKASLLAGDQDISIQTAILAGNSAGAIVEYVKKNKIDLLIIGDTGHSSIWGALLGTSAEKIVRDAPCSVLLVR